MLALSYQDYALAGGNGEDRLSSEGLRRTLGHALTPLVDGVAELL